MKSLNENCNIIIEFGKIYRLLSAPFVKGEDFIYLTKKYFVQVGYLFDIPEKVGFLRGNQKDVIYGSTFTMLTLHHNINVIDPYTLLTHKHGAVRFWAKKYLPIFN